MRRIFGVLAVGLIAVLLVSCGGERQASVGGGDSKSNAERDRSVIYVAVSPDSEPFEYIDDDGDFNGFDIALAMKIGEELERTPVFVNRSREDIFSCLNCGIAEIALSSLESTDAARQKVDFSDAYITLSSSIIKNVYDTRITDLKSLGAARSIGVVQDSLSDKFLSENTAYANIIKYRDFEAAAQAFEAGEAEALYADSYLAEEYVNSNSEAETVPGGDKVQYAIAADKGNSALIKQLNEIISRFRRDGTLLDLRRAYLGYNMELNQLFTSEVKQMQHSNVGM